jgi:hypothetical protein
MSLSYHSEHLAWKQRVNQEISRATQFHSTYESYKRRGIFGATGKSNSSARTKSVGYDGSPGGSNGFLNSATMGGTRYSKHDDDEYKNGKVNLGYSFGGTHHIKNAFKEGENAEADSQNGNGIIRPRTKSMVGRSSKRSRRVMNKDQDIQVLSSRPLSKEQPLKRRSKPKSQSSTVRSVPKSVKEVEEGFDQYEEIPEEFEDKFEDKGSEDTQEGDQSPDKEVQDDKQSTHSKLTTLSQAKYIEELESKLREEKLKRMRAELELKKLSKNT